ncbi:hypothetical protein GOP47_0005016 [Adiantum capillus-veneris]|uniref:Proteasome assembly chaperone 2 n=1 Tax=Adiantum capillus-veneris TaxID=13818 RepID=A0A9D4ZMV0_ADICA|nr:hypothetical protein GOP47_0005016 [Adiantum capillus-veneris]
MEFYAVEQRSMKAEPMTLLTPALSIGNVGQLAVDLLIASLQTHKVGYLDDPCILPCIGNDPYHAVDKGELAVALEVYEEQDDDLRIVQQRAPVIKGSMLKFSRSFSNWANSNNTGEVVILSGVDSGKRPMRDIGSSPIRYISTANPDGTDPRCEALGWKKLEDYLPSSDAWRKLDAQSLQEEDEALKDTDLQMSDEMYYPSLPFASLFSCCKARGLKAVCILLFCSEGDNIQDAFFLGDALQIFRSLNTIGSRPQTWNVPYSWRSVYGPPPDPTMY